MPAEGSAGWHETGDTGDEPRFTYKLTGVRPAMGKVSLLR